MRYKNTKTVNPIKASNKLSYILVRTFMGHLDRHNGYREGPFFREVVTWIAKSSGLRWMLEDDHTETKNWDDYRSKWNAISMQCVDEIVMNKITVIANARDGLSVAHLTLGKWLHEFLPDDVEVLRSKQLQSVFPKRGLWKDLACLLSKKDDAGYQKNSASETWINRSGDIYLRSGNCVIHVQEELAIIDVIRACGIAYEIGKEPKP